MTKRATAAERRFTLLDAIIFVAATAVGLACGRGAYRLIRSEGIGLGNDKIDQAITLGLLFGCPILVSWSIALLATSLMPPRPPLVRLCRRPGFVLNASILLGTAYVVLHFGILTAAQPGATAVNLKMYLSNVLPRMTGQFVAGALLCLALERRWRPYPVWTDRLGYALGGVWLCGLPAFWLFDILPLL